MLTHLKTLFTFYELHTAKTRFSLYKGKQQTQEYMANMLLNGTPKYNRRKEGRKILIDGGRSKRIKKDQR